MTALPSKSPLETLVFLLGGPAMLSRPITNSLDLMRAAEAGVPVQAVRHLQRHLSFSNREMSAVLAISESTLTRRENAKTNLTRDESEKAIQLAALVAHGLETFTTEEAFSDWLHAKNTALGNITPQSLLDSALGRDQVRSILYRIQHGIYS